MKTIKLSAAMTAILFGLSINTASAKSWRVNHDTTTGANFASIKAAMDAKDAENNYLVNEGDTLYLDPGMISTEAATISRRVTIIGTGYMRASSPHQFAHVSHALTITAEGTKIEGLWCGNIFLKATNITIERCYSTGNLLTDDGSTNYKHTGIVIRQCYITGQIGSNSSTSNNYYMTNATIENNIIRSSSGSTSSTSPIHNLYGCDVRNNYVIYNGTDSDPYAISGAINSHFYNNILFNSYNIEKVINVGPTCISNNNIYSSSPIASDDESADPIRVDDNNNYRLGSATESEIFAMSGNNDERYSELKEGSPAIGFGVDGVDCGPTGGLYPYVVSGLPAYHPYYTNAVFSKTSDGTGINVSLKIKMQNE
jgi:hypothetical protein